MTFIIPRFRLKAAAIEHCIDLSDFLEEFDTEDVLKTLAQKDANLDTILFEFIDSHFSGGFDGFIEKFKEKE